MYQIRQFFVNSVQRSQTVNLEVVKLVLDEFQKRLGHTEVISDSDHSLSVRSIEDLMLQFAVVRCDLWSYYIANFGSLYFINACRSEAEMVGLMRNSLESGQAAFDVIISPFGCDSKSLPLRIRQQLDQEDEVVDELPKRTGRVSNFGSPAATPTSTPKASSASPLSSSSSMCRQGIRLCF